MARKSTVQQLPVAARPAVLLLARSRNLVVHGKFFEQIDVGRERGARENSFEKIVAQKSVVGHLIGQRRLKRIDIVGDPFAGEGILRGTDPLVNVRKRLRSVGVDAARSRKSFW